MSRRMVFDNIAQPILLYKLKNEFDAANIQIMGILVDTKFELVEIEFVADNPTQADLDTALAIIQAHDPVDIIAENKAIDSIQVQATAAIDAINAALVEANSDLAGWDLMTTLLKIDATRRILVRQIDILQRQRAIIKYVRWV